MQGLTFPSRADEETGDNPWAQPATRFEDAPKPTSTHHLKSTVHQETLRNKSAGHASEIPTHAVSSEQSQPDETLATVGALTFAVPPTTAQTQLIATE